jgi:predicted dienelactone hydrolase
MKRLLPLVAAATLCWGAGAENRIDRVRPDAPELAAFGAYAVGVRTLEVVNRNEIDVLKVSEGEELPRYDRPLTLEVWYPAEAGGEPTPYDVYLRDGRTSVQVQGRASRESRPDRSGAPYPLVLISHGYPGNRYLLSHLGENLASKGYVVASIDHTDSTYRTRAAFPSTLVNRSLDQHFVLGEMARLGAADGHPLAGLVDAERTGLIGYSMGGYGAVITAGGGVTQEAVERGAPAGTLGVHRAGSEAHGARFDERIKAVVAFAPWGMEAGFWDAEGLAGMKIPTLFVAGSVDDVSGYEKGVRAIWEQAVNIDRHLLTFEHANHNAAAPMPAPDETYDWGDGNGPTPFGHYADPVWDTTRMNNIAQHFVTAYFGAHLKADDEMHAYLDLVPSSNDGVWAAEPNGEQRPEHSHWKGFQNRTAKGLMLERLEARQQVAQGP